MARYIEADCRLCRRSGEKLMLKGDKCINNCTFEKRPRPPGPQATRRRRLSDRGVQLREKQKVRYAYGVLEAQFKRFFENALRQPGVTGDTLLVMLERRLDNVVYRLGFADSRDQARQLVAHGHILVNARKTNIPSFLVKEGNVVAFRPGSTKTKYYQQLVELIKGKTVPAWLSLDKPTVTGRVLSLPTPGDVEAKYQGKKIVEYYSR